MMSRKSFFHFLLTVTVRPTLKCIRSLHPGISEYPIFVSLFIKMIFTGSRLLTVFNLILESNGSQHHHVGRNISPQFGDKFQMANSVFRHELCRRSAGMIAIDHNNKTFRSDISLIQAYTEDCNGTHTYIFV